MWRAALKRSGMVRDSENVLVQCALDRFARRPLVGIFFPSSWSFPLSFNRKQKRDDDDGDTNFCNDNFQSQNKINRDTQVEQCSDALVHVDCNSLMKWAPPRCLQHSIDDVFYLSNSGVFFLRRNGTLDFGAKCSSMCKMILRRCEDTVYNFNIK